MPVMKSSQTRGLIGPKMLMPFFTPQPGKEYRMLFIPFEDDALNAVALAGVIHQITTGHNKREPVRCLHGEPKYVDGTDILEINGPTGNPVRDGSCPFCKYWDILNNNIFSPKYTEWLESDEGKSATEDKKKEKWGELSRKSPIQKIQTMRYYPAAVVEIDARGNAVVDVQTGKPKYDLQLVRITDNQFNTKLDAAADGYRKLEQQSGKNEISDGLAGREFVFKYPNLQDKMEMAMRMSIGTAQYNVYDAIKEDIYREIWDKDLEKLDSQISAFQLRSIDSANMMLQPHLSTMDALFVQFGVDKPEALALTTGNLSADDVNRHIGVGSDDAINATIGGTPAGTAPAAGAPAAGGDAAATDIKPDHNVTLSADEIGNALNL